MKIEPATWADVRDVAFNMRDRDFAEFCATYPTDDRRTLAAMLGDRYGDRDEIMVGFHNDELVCIGGAVQVRPNVAHLLFFATSVFPKVALALTRWITRQLFPRLEQAGIHRIDVVSLQDHSEAHAWLRTLGFEQEAELSNYGKNREPFVQFARFADVRPIGA